VMVSSGQCRLLARHMHVVLEMIRKARS
jgi:hypothetical protein